MYRLLENHGKTIMIFVAVGLMIVFVLPAGLQGLQAAPDPVLGTVADGGELRQSEADAAGRRMANLLRLYAGTQDGRSLPLAAALLGPGFNPEDGVTAALLFREADSRGGLADEATEVTPLLTSGGVLVRGEGQLVPYAQYRPADANDLAAVRQAAADLILLNKAQQRGLDFVKISEPLADLAVSRQAQEISVKFALVDAQPLLADVPEPTDAQVRALFDQYADTAPGTVTRDNPLGLGYRQPDRVKLQAIVVPEDAVAEQVEATRDELGWETEAYKYYLRNEGQFVAPEPPATQPAALTTRPAEEPTDGPAGPRVLPFEEVREQAIQAVKGPPTRERLQTIVSYVRGELDAGVRRLAAAEAADEPLDVAQTLGQDPRSFEFLAALADDVQQRFKVRPKIVDLSDKFRSAQELQAAEAVGDSLLIDPQRGLIPGPALAFNVAGVTPPAGLNLPKSDLYRPLPTLDGGDGASRVVLRVTDTAQAGPAADFDALRQAVAADARRQEALTLAVERAKALAENNFQSVPPDEVTQTGRFTGASPAAPEGFPADLPPRAAAEFVNGAFRLLGDEDRAGGVALPSAFQAAAVRLLEVRPAYATADALAATRRREADLIRRQFRSQLQPDYANPQSVRQRLGFDPADGQTPDGETPDGAADATPAAPVDAPADPA